MPGPDQGNDINNNSTCAYTFDFLKTQMDKAIIDYTTNLPSGADVHNVFTFNGIINNIYITVFKSLNASQLDIKLLDHVFDYYCFVCNSHNKQVYIIQFLLMIGLDQNTYNRWLNGVERASAERMGICNKWRTTCEASLVSASDVKSMFLLKAKYGYVEATAPVVIQHELRQETPDLVAKYKDYPTIID